MFNYFKLEAQLLKNVVRKYVKSLRKTVMSTIRRRDGQHGCFFL